MSAPSPPEPLDGVTGVILCGGRGERLRPFTESLPKPLVPLKGRALLGHLLDFLSLHGLRRIILCTGYRAAEIEGYVEANQRPGIAASIQAMSRWPIESSMPERSHRGGY